MPCYKATMEPVRKVIRREEILFFLRFHGLWEGIIQLPRPPPPPFDIDTMEPIEPPWQAMKERIAAASSWAAEITDNPTQAMLAWIIIFSILGSVGTLAGAVLMLFFLTECRLTDQDNDPPPGQLRHAKAAVHALLFRGFAWIQRLAEFRHQDIFPLTPSHGHDYAAPPLHGQNGRHLDACPVLRQRTNAARFDG
jgi:hypothetical protein